MNRLDPKRRQKGVLISIVGILLNLALAGGKLAAGFIFNLVSVLADGFNHLSDCASGIASLVSFYIADKPPDSRHPFGHRRAETIAAMATSFLVLFLAVELLKSSIQKILSGESSQVPSNVFLFLACSIAVKAGMFVLFFVWSKKISSRALYAAAMDSLCDCAATSAVILGALITSFPADGWTGLFVSLFITLQGLKLLKDSCSDLLGQAPDPKLIGRIKSILLAKEQVLGIHDLQIYSYGKGAYFATVHIEMDSNLTSIQAHLILDELERKIRQEENVILTAHFDPVDLSDEEARILKEKLIFSVKDLADGLEVHDFKIIRGEKVKVIFDAGVPYACKISDGELRRELECAVKKLGAYVPIITLERE